MAAPADKATRPNGLAGSSNADLITQQSNVVASLRLLCAKLDLDAGVTDTNYAALITDAAIATAPKKLITTGF